MSDTLLCVCRSVRAFSSRILVRYCSGVSPKQEKEYLDAISTSANALLMLINDVLDLSKLEANQMQIVTAFTDFNALCREAGLTLHFKQLDGTNSHHIIEAAFKAFGRALREAVSIDPAAADAVPSTKGVLV